MNKEDLKTPGEFLKWYRKNKNYINIPHDASKFSDLCGLIIKGRIELGEITPQDLEETDRFWACLKGKGYRRMPNKKEWKEIEVPICAGHFLN